MKRPNEKERPQSASNGKPRSPASIMAFEKAKALWLIERELGPQEARTRDESET